MGQILAIFSVIHRKEARSAVLAGTPCRKLPGLTGPMTGPWDPRNGPESKTWPGLFSEGQITLPEAPMNTLGPEKDPEVSEPGVSNGEESRNPGDHTP